MGGCEPTSARATQACGVGIFFQLRTWLPLRPWRVDPKIPPQEFWFLSSKAAHDPQVYYVILMVQYNIEFMWESAVKGSARYPGSRVVPDPTKFQFSMWWPYEPLGSILFFSGLLFPATILITTIYCKFYQSKWQCVLLSSHFLYDKA